MVPKVLRKRSSSCTTCRPPSSSRSTINARGLLRLASPMARSLPSGEFCSSAITSFSLSWSASIQFQTFCDRSRGMTRLDCSVQRRSKMIATEAIEHRIIGHMKPPPARMISHIVSSLKTRTGGMILERPHCRYRHQPPTVNGVMRARAALDQNSVGQGQHPIEARCQALVMGHDDEAGTELAIQLQHELEHLRGVHAVEIAGRLVRQNELRPGDQGARHRGALALAAGELRGPMGQAFA